MSVLGQFWVIAALVSSAGSAYTYVRAATRRTSSFVLPRRLAITAAVSLLLASASLLTLLLGHDFSNGYVFSYSDRSLPLHYLLSSFYAGQEGSFLFWAVCSGLIAVVLARSARKNKSEPGVMAVFIAVQTLLLLLVAVKSPFRSVWEMFPSLPASRVPADGRGLNPLLQNFWMVIHPPVLFLGFASMAVPFSLALSALWMKKFDALPVQAVPWLLFSTVVLGLGIMLGAYWAYGVLGWGGYWGWDPVENSSLIPWLTGVALLHTLIAQMRTGRFRRTNFVLALVTFLLVVYSTFLTRSGILGDASVHAFTDPGATVYWMLLGVLALIAATGVGLMLSRWKELKPVGPAAPLLARESSLGAGSIALVLSAAVVLFGTSLPIFSTSRVDADFYNTANLPLVIIIVLLMGFALTMQWNMQDGALSLRKSLRALGIAILLTVALGVAGVRDTLALVVFFACFFAVAMNVEIGLKVLLGDPLFLGGKIAHIGIAVFLIGVVASGRFGLTQQVGLPLGVPTRVLDRTLTYLDAHVNVKGRRTFDVAVDGQEGRVLLSPVMFSAGEQGVLRNPDIASFMTKDLYLSPLSVENPSTPGTETYTLQKGRPVAIDGLQATFVSFSMNPGDRAAMEGGSGGTMIGSVLDISDGHEHETITPVTLYREGEPPRAQSTPSRLMNANVQLLSMHVSMTGSGSTVTLGIEHQRETSRAPEILFVEASIKPFIGLVWSGTVLMIGGFLLSLVKRWREA